MSAPSIPNLLSLRGRGGARGRSRGRGQGPGGGSGPESRGKAHDATIQGTDTDAAVSRLSAVDMGYLSDPYARYFVSSLGGPPARRFPIINRGTYARTAAIDRLVYSFLFGAAEGAQSQAVATRQIISLGAGTDTRPFRLFGQQHQGQPNLIYHEFDFSVTSAKKLKTVEGVPPLASILSNRSTGETSDWSSKPQNGEYYCHGLDIRQLSSTSTKTLPGLRTDVPTLILSECCLCYLSREESDGVLEYFTSRIPNAAVVIYEPIHLGDPFSDTMVSNLAARNIHMPSLERRRNEADEAARLERIGFGATRQLTIDRIWSKWVNTEEKERVDRLEGLDEIEEWQLLAGHYMVIWSFRGKVSRGGTPLNRNISQKC